MNAPTMETPADGAAVAQVTIVTATAPPRLAKLFYLSRGELIKKGAGSVAAGRVEVCDVPTLAALVEILGSLQPDQALIFGYPDDCAVTEILSSKVAEEHEEKVGPLPPHVATRTAENFRWNTGPGYLMLDYDPAPDTQPLTRDEFLEVVYAAAPELRGAPCVWSVSASSCIFNADTGEELRGISGQRLYILVADARDIPRAGKALFDTLVLQGHGYIQLSKSAAQLKRAPVDASVWQTNRLDFAAPPVCMKPLEARRPAPIIFNPDAAPVDTLQAIPALSPSEERRVLKIWDEKRSAPEFQKARVEVEEAWVEGELAKAEATGGALPESEREERRSALLAAVRSRKLYGDFELLHRSGQCVTVGEVLDNPDKWHGERFADPLEWDYSNNDHRITWCNLHGGSPYLYSHAHGGQRFKLLRATSVMTLDAGEAPQYLPKIFERLREEGDIYERAGLLVRLAETELLEVKPPWLQTRLEQCFEFEKYDARAQRMKRVDCPDSLAKRVLAARGDWGLPKVTGITQFPVIRPDGSLLSQPGVDPDTGLLLLGGSAEPRQPSALSREELSAALRRVWEPFALFPFADDLSRGIFFSALLTVVCRVALPTAPAFLIRAHTAGTGKTLLSECLLLLIGARLAAMPMPENTDEVEKRLFAKLLTGSSGVMIDNVKGDLDHASLCAFLTSGEPECRILGKSEIVTVTNRAIWILNGNNVVASGDTFRRVLPVTLDAGVETPETRRFSFDPRALIRQDLEAYRCDLASILMTFVEERSGEPAGGSLGSFEAWEGLVRQCVCWLIAEGLAPAAMADPASVLALSREEDPVRGQLGALLSAWDAYYQQQVVTVREIARKVNFPHEFSGGAKREAVAQLCEAALDVAEFNGKFNTRSLGRFLLRHQGVVVDGLRVDQVGKGRVATWQVTRVSPAEE